METLTLLVCHICLYLKPFPPYNSFAERRERAPEKHRQGETAGKCDSTENVYPASPPPPPPPPDSSSSDQCMNQERGSEKEGGERRYGSAWPARPTEVERMCCPAGEHVNTEGEKNFLQAKAFPPSRTPSTRRLHMQGRRKGGWRWRRRRENEADGEEGNENCREMEKGIEWQEKEGGESGWPEKKWKEKCKRCILTWIFLDRKHSERHEKCGGGGVRFWKQGGNMKEEVMRVSQVGPSRLSAEGQDTRNRSSFLNK